MYIVVTETPHMLQALEQASVQTAVVYYLISGDVLCRWIVYWNRKAAILTTARSSSLLHIIQWHLGNDVSTLMIKVPFEIPHKISYPYPYIERCFLYTDENLRTLIFKSSYAFLKHPLVSNLYGTYTLSSLYLIAEHPMVLSNQQTQWWLHIYIHHIL